MLNPLAIWRRLRQFLSDLFVDSYIRNIQHLNRCYYRPAVSKRNEV